MFRLSGKGMPRLGGRGHGDLYVEIKVTVPKKLSRKAKRILEDLKEELGEN